MANEDKRKNIKVNESVFEDFSDRCHAYNFTHSEMLQSLLQKEIIKTETTSMANRVEKGTDFDNCVKNHNLNYLKNNGSE